MLTKTAYDSSPSDIRFPFVDLGCQGGISDGGVFNNSSLFSKLKRGELKFPPDGEMPAFDKVLPYVFLGNSMFAFKSPYDKTISWFARISRSSLP
ncbi:hypothetical protein AVEN_145217-1 [Araneus ventricosus]|uniref:DDE Tnp4 domain-containing protein n=1 Tax=Araneus ventricosus TaxID=182803 RepID=A0A4Y2CP79_ARAVE|nr:hypothetical protein AVEN_145217-1 [Araneus ventricosus]